MNAVNNEADITLKQSSHDYIKTTLIENEPTRLENSQPQLKKLSLLRK